MRTPTKTKDTLSKVLPLRWSLGSKDRQKTDPMPPLVQAPGPAELVEYLESGRRPRCTKDPIVTLMAGPTGSKAAAESQSHSRFRSPSAGSLSCMGKSGEDPLESPQVPEGQKRPSEKRASLRRSKEGQSREEGPNISSSSSSNTLTRRKDARKQSSSKNSQDTELKRSSSAGVQPSYSSPSLHDGTLRRWKGDRGERGNDQAEHQGSNGRESKSRKGDAPKSNEGLLSFFKGSFLRKDSKKSKEEESGRRAAEEGGTRSVSRHSLSNGAAGGRAGAEGGKSGGSGRTGDELANGKIGRAVPDIKRSQSSSSIPTRAEQSMRRTASLHRNGTSTATDKASHGALQRTRYSTTSLGRKKTVPESSF